DAVDVRVLDLLGVAFDENVVLDHIVLSPVHHHGATVGVDDQVAVDVNPARVVIEINAPAKIRVPPDTGLKHAVAAGVVDVVEADDAAALVNIPRAHANGSGIGLLLAGVVHVVVLNDIAHAVEEDGAAWRVVNEVVR